ncbi:hypothetical protein C464_06170 [Halorubrum coriense DSM 10284]|uniref:Uncharacterized protein n=1 Tax=Halorubrum coriense DSM 10284 TaxID=1227466 RepID=M0ERC9_9EURY|nr:hypothetical protein C464_06170 [Halorubrum coriense DSM 10284]
MSVDPLHDVIVLAVGKAVKGGQHEAPRPPQIGPSPEVSAGGDEQRERDERDDDRSPEVSGR